MKLILVISGIFLVSSVHTAIPRVDPLVQINQGLVRGQQASDGDYSYFLGVPYAQVDLNNPFGPAQPHPGFGQDIFNAYDGSLICPQMDLTGQRQNTARNETLDCLRLNIYVPYRANSRNPLPVLVWIHGGGFNFGYGSEYYPRQLVSQGIIVVTINYRLGAYGFMCLDSPLAPGNQGLKDQYEALRWIRNNIAAFGGNPYNVTIAGQSAGSMSVLFHLYSSKDKLFRKIIAESGTPLSLNLFREGDTEAAVKIANYLGYNTTETEQALQFLAEATPQSVNNAAFRLQLVLGPCRENSFSGVDNFIETDPFSLSNENKVRNTPVLIGHTSQEINDINMYGSGYFRTDPFVERIETSFNLSAEELTEIASILRHFYIGDEAISADLTFELADFESDFFMNYPVEKTITNLLNENAGPVYSYIFSYVGDTGATAAGHNAELSYLFPTTELNGEAQLVSDRITTLWANFIKYGNPTPETTNLLPVTWTPVTTNSRPYMEIDNELQLKSRVYHKRMAFWDLFYSSYSNNLRLLRGCSL